MGCCQAKPTTKEPGEHVLDAAPGSEALPLTEQERQAFLSKIPRQGYFDLEYEPKSIQSDKACVLAAVKLRGYAVKHASDDLKSDKEIMFAALSQRGSMLEYATDPLKADKQVVLAAVTNSGIALQYAADSLKADAEVVQAAVTENGSAAEYASEEMHKIVPALVELAVVKNGFHFPSIPDSLKGDEAIVLAAVSQSGFLLRYAHDSAKRNVHIAMAAAASDNGDALQYAPDEVTGNEKFVMQLLQKNGMSLKHVAKKFQQDEKFVLAAVRQNGVALKFAHESLNQKAECLKAAGLWDEELCQNQKKAIQSVKFSLAATTSSYATEFTLALKRDPYLSNFQMYNPNAWCKKSCGVPFTDMNNLCRGTRETCKNPKHVNQFDDQFDPVTKKPNANSCWRVSFRFHQEESKADGFMIQVEEFTGLGDGQKIETHMAVEAGLKVFRTFTDEHNKPNCFAMKKIAQAIEDWDNKGQRQDMRLENIYIGASDYEHARPRYNDEPKKDVESMETWRKRTKGY